MRTSADHFFQYRVLGLWMQQSASLRLLRSGHAAMSISFLYKIYRVASKPLVPLEELTQKLADYLSAIGFIEEGEADGMGFLSNDVYERAKTYIQRWAEDENRFIHINIDDKTHEPYATLSRYTEKVFQALELLRDKDFVGTESKLLDLMGKVEELVQRSNSNPEERIKELQTRKRQIEEEIKQIRKTGEVLVYEPWQIKSRWAEIERLAAELSGDFREVEENFKEIYKTISRRHADATLSKGQLLRLTFDALEELRANDQGRSFYAFWEFLMDDSRQQQFEQLLVQLYDMLDKTGVEYPNRHLLQLKTSLHQAGAKVLETNKLLGYKLSRIVVEKHTTDHRKTRQLLNGILQQAIQHAEVHQKSNFGVLVDDRAQIYLPLERRLGEAPATNQFTKAPNNASLSLDQLVNLHRLVDDGSIDRAELRQRIATLLKTRTQISLAQVVQAYPCTRGLAEALAYISLATTLPGTTISSALAEDILFDATNHKYLQVPQIIFTKK